jgi:predicted secreted protein
MPLPIAGIGGKYIFEFEAIAEGEAEITVYNNFRRRDSIHIITYKAVVDKKSKVTLTEKYPNGTF